MYQPKNSFFIIGTSTGGTSLLHGCMVKHPQVQCHYEWFENRTNPEKQMKQWTEDSRKVESIGQLWGCKVPYEQFVTSSANWTLEEITSLIDYFKILFIQRRYSMYAKKDAHRENFRTWWEGANFHLYWAMREKAPERILLISYETLVLQPQAELFRICRFLGIRFEYEEMKKGTANAKSRILVGWDRSRI